MARTLIVNADDCNLTPGVTRAILDCHDRGILTSTTFMMNLPVTALTINAMKKRKNLGVGIHLNITYGPPVSPAKKIQSLITPGGQFKKRAALLTGKPRLQEIIREYQMQIERFRKTFGRLPTHLDTHHQLHDDPYYFRAIAEISRRFHLPVRRSRLISQPEYRRALAVPPTDYFFGNLTPEGFWREEAAVTVLKNLPSGTSEMMCHPGQDDRQLRSISSFHYGRKMEWQLLRSSRLRNLIRDCGISLSHFGLCYTS